MKNNFITTVFCALFLTWISTAHAQSSTSIDKVILDKQAYDSLPPKAALPQKVPLNHAQLKKKMDEALSKLAHEPSLHKLKQAALKLADADVKSVEGWMRSTNLAAILPVMKFTAKHDFERDESLDRYQDEPDRWGADTDRDLGFQVSAQWTLGELVFNPDEVRVYRALANRAARREAVVTLLIGYYFERRRLIIEDYILPINDKRKAIEHKIRIQELTASIDALTGGLLLRTISK